jgi:two-component system cell cycle sensor histidine kinase/response regulator CckA
MKNDHTQLALSRTSTTNQRRLAFLAGFTVAMFLVREMVFPVPKSVFMLFGTWFVTALVYHLILRRATTHVQADRLQALAFGIDITFLTLMYTFMGGGWWMGASIHAIIAMSAFASLPRRRARIIAGYAAVAFVAMIASQSLGFTRQYAFLGIQPITGNYAFGAAAALLGLAAILAGSSVQSIFVRIMRRSQERYRVILETAPDIILTIATDLTIVSANEATYVQTGRARVDLIGKPVIQFVHPDDAQLMQKHVRATIDGESRQFEIRYFASDGKQVTLLCGCNPIRDDELVTSALLVGRDITDRKNAEERVRASESLLMETQRLARLGSWEWDVAANEVTWSDELYRIFGMRRDGVLTFESYLERVHPDEREIARTTVERSLATHEPFSTNTRVLRPDGEERKIHALGHVVVNEHGNVVKMIGSAQDVTEQIQLTEQLRQAQKMEAIGRLAGGVAHDFNNLLTVMDCHIQFLLQDMDPKLPQVADVEAIRKATGHAADLTRQLLAFSRKQIIQPKVLNLNESIQSVETLIRRLLGENISIVTRLDPNPSMVRADPGQIEQLIMNLAVNARDAMPMGGTLTIQTRTLTVTDVHARSRPGMRTGAHVILSISDTGEGIPDDVKPHIFEPFFTTKPVGQGTGLGLSTVYGIIKQNSGYVDVVSAIGRGTTFNLYFPLTTEEAAALTPQFVAEAGLSGTETVLLAEDANALRQVIERILSSNGYNVIVAKNGEDALRLFEKHTRNIDALLTDVVMPGLSGRELVSSILEKRPSLPVLFMSGYAENAAIGRLGLSAGHGFILKPFTPESLLRKLRDMLDRADYARAQLPPLPGSTGKEIRA